MPFTHRRQRLVRLLCRIVATVSLVVCAVMLVAWPISYWRHLIFMYQQPEWSVTLHAGTGTFDATTVYPTPWYRTEELGFVVRARPVELDWEDGTFHFRHVHLPANGGSNPFYLGLFVPLWFLAILFALHPLTWLILQRRWLRRGAPGQVC